MYKLRIAQLAHEDLVSIVSYITVELANPVAAADFLDEVEKCYDYLKRNPMMYSKCTNVQLESEGYRKALIKNYILIFKIVESSNIVNVMRFFYGARDYEKFL